MHLPRHHFASGSVKISTIILFQSCMIDSLATHAMVSVARAKEITEKEKGRRGKREGRG